MERERRTFPTLPPTLATNLKAVERLMEFDGGYLSDPRCTYPEELKVYLRRLIGPTRAGREDTAALMFKKDADDEAQVDSLLVEIQKALNSMRQIREELDHSGAETKEKMDFIKSFGNLMDRFLALKEKSNGLKQMYEFQRLTISILEQHLDKDQILLVKDGLKKILEQGEVS